jgi:hypothetical protein
MAAVLSYSQLCCAHPRLCIWIILNIFILYKKQGVNVVEGHSTENKDERRV